MPGSRIKRRVGVFGGTFDPVHNGHLAIADAVRSELDLEKVLFVVAADQWLRANPPQASARDRLRMVELAVENIPGFETSDVDIVRGGSTFTADTLVDLRGRLGETVELYLIVGADSALAMDRWKRAEEISALARIVVVGRPGLVFENETLDDTHPARGAMYVEGPMVDVSATDIRGLLQSTGSISGLVADSVEDYINTNGFYG
ncbi:MAG: nicotinate-nucleotide adenylyltransferase [Chloroflexi bacterium]|nr:nicotinate-nucleotide adenylyltransferase [Chloroflexota bacterium]